MSAGLEPLCANQPFHSSRLERVFRTCFEESENTLLRGGALEPFYQPAECEKSVNLLIYREDFFASALHEIAHWCIAGSARRTQRDFGYWYAPEGRSAGQQAAFEAVEVKPQALEWFFSRACDYRFQVSVDNFNEDTGELPDTRDFCEKVLFQATHWRQQGLPDRAAQFYAALCREFATNTQAAELTFAVDEIG